MAKHVDVVTQARKWANRAAYFRLVPTILIWALFLFIPRNALVFGFLDVAVIIGYLVAGIWLTGGMYRVGMSVARQAYFLFSYFAILVGSFSLAYWSYGQAPYFNTDLTRLDAVYFTIGTLSTAGTGNIVATSELIRAVQGAQMVIDLGLVLFSVAVVVARFATSDNRSDLPPPS